MQCIVCASEKQELAYESVEDWEYDTYKPVDLYQCADCGLIYQNPMPAVEDIPSFYPETYRNYLPVGSGIFSELKKIRFKGQAKALAKFFDEADSILEIGYGNGQLLMALKSLGYHKLCGADLSNKASEVLKVNGIEAKVANVEAELPFADDFDVIIMNNVIEHFLDPMAVLKNSYEKLKPGGRLILLTPNTDAMELKIYKKYWAGFHMPRHTYLFNKSNLERAARDIGFSDFEFHKESDPAQWAFSLQNLLQTTALKTKLKNGMAPYAILLTLAAAPFSIIQALMGNSESMLCVLRK